MLIRLSLLILLTLVLPFSAARAGVCNKLLASAFHVNEWVLDQIVLGRKISSPAEDISAQEFAQIQNTVAGILKQYPPKDYFYVGLGRSPTPFLAFLRAIGLRDFANIPLSSMRSHPNSPTLEVDSQPLPDSLKARLFFHFDRHVPSLERLQGRKILLFDYVQSGSSLMAAKAYLELFRQSHPQAGEIEVLALVDGKLPVVPELESENQILIPDGMLKQHLRQSAYDSFALVTGFFLGSAGTADGINPDSRFQELVYEFKARIAARQGALRPLPNN